MNRVERTLSTLTNDDRRPTTDVVVVVVMFDGQSVRGVAIGQSRRVMVTMSE